MSNEKSSRRGFLFEFPTLASGVIAASYFVPVASSAKGIADGPAGFESQGVAGQSFLQVSLYKKFAKETDRAFFKQIDRYYTPLVLKAPGLIRYQRFRHYDLPQILDLQYWENLKMALAFYDTEKAKQAWQTALAHMPPELVKSLPQELHKPTHSNAHRHFILLETLKA